jgi:hypothetical protein
MSQINPINPQLLPAGATMGKAQQARDNPNRQRRRRSPEEPEQTPPETATEIPVDPQAADKPAHLDIKV